MWFWIINIITFVYFPIETNMAAKMATNTGTGKGQGAMFNTAKCSVSKETQDLLNRK